MDTKMSLCNPPLRRIIYNLILPQTSRQLLQASPRPFAKDYGKCSLIRNLTVK